VSRTTLPRHGLLLVNLGTPDAPRTPEVRRYLREADQLGVKEYYFTGGEPFLNPEILPILEAALAQGPVTVLTNGLLIRDETARRLRRLWDGSPYSLDLRISIDGWDAATNDPIRGEGTYARILEGLRNLAAEGVNPVVTVTEACEGVAAVAGRERFLDWARSIGLSRPRLKVLSLFRIGAEAERLLRHVLEIAPEHPYAGRELARVLLADATKVDERVQEAELLVNARLDKDLEDWRAYELMGDVAMVRDDFEAAVAYYTEALRYHDPARAEELPAAPRWARYGENDAFLGRFELTPEPGR